MSGFVRNGSTIGDGHISTSGLNTFIAVSTKKASKLVEVCYSPDMITTNGVWRGENPLHFSLSLFILQVILITITTRFLEFILKPLRQPRIVSKILGGVVLGPSVLGQSIQFREIIFPTRSVILLESIANLGILYFLFIIGIEMDLTMIKRIGKKELTIAFSGMVLPFIVGVTYALVDITIEGKNDFLSIFAAVILSVTAFPVLAQILAELKLLSTELGRIAMSVAIINDIFAWILLVLGIALTEDIKPSLASLGVVFSAIAFVVLCIFVIRPAIFWIIRQTPDDDNFNDFYIHLILVGVIVCGFITDTIGTHSVFGAFVFGLIIPNGRLATVLIDKLDDFVSGLFLPLYFSISGLKTNIQKVGGGQWGYAFFTMILASGGKVVCTILICLFYKMRICDGVTLGLLLNSKGLIEMIVLNVGRDHQVVDELAFAQMVLMIVLMTSIIMPLVTFIYRPARNFVPNKCRTLQMSRPDAELRILACLHTPRNVPTIIHLLDASHPTKKSPFYVYALHLVELTARATATLIIHNSGSKSNRSSLKRAQAQSDHIINAFENYMQHSGFVSVQALTAISPCSTMHEDICNLAEDKRVAFIIVPFHKQQAVDGRMEVTNPSFQSVNQKILANAPCSIGILIDRGLGEVTRVVASTSHTTYNMAILFFGGPDDREALSYAWRMSEHPGVNLTVLHFLPGDDVVEPVIFSSNDDDPRILTVITDNEREKQRDNELISEFRVKNKNNESIVYKEKVVNNSEETMAVIRSMEGIHDLYIVGRGQGMVTPLTAGLTDWSECPELGAIGDLLASSDFAASESVLVVQQYVGVGPQLGDGLET